MHRYGGTGDLVGATLQHIQRDPRRYARLRSATMHDFVLTDNEAVHTTFSRAIAAKIRHTAVSSGLSYKSKYALEATQQTMNGAYQFFERVQHLGGSNFSVVHSDPDTGLPPSSVALFRNRRARTTISSFWA